jgi:hypothetical protein
MVSAGHEHVVSGVLNDVLAVAGRDGPVSRKTFATSRQISERGLQTYDRTARRLYAVAHEPLRGIDAWLDQFRRSWTPHLDALATELARGKHERRNKP